VIGLATSQHLRDRAPRGYATGDRQRQNVVATTIALLERVPVSELSLRQVAEASGLTAPGLMRHYPSVAALLTAVIEHLLRDQAAWISAVDLDLSAPRDLVALAEHNDATPGYVPLFASLAGPATSPEHPAHDFFREQYRTVRSALTAAAASSGRDGARVAEGRAVHLVALWDGLQALSLYDPAVSVPAALEYDLLGPGAAVDRIATDGHATREQYLDDARADDAGYEVGRERRAEIVDRAGALFARVGYRGTTMRALADDLGIPKSSIMHHFRTKEDLLTAVLAHRDLAVVPPGPPAADPVDELFTVTRAAAGADRGLTALYAVLSGEAVVPGHAAHDYFARRSARVRSYLTGLFARAQEAGAMAPERDAATEALRLVALWDGLQIQWLYDSAGVDVAGALHEHLANTVTTVRSTAEEPAEPTGGDEANAARP
jgi:AcrR family transcriptional regulator